MEKTRSTEKQIFIAVRRHAEGACALQEPLGFNATTRAWSRLPWLKPVWRATRDLHWEGCLNYQPTIVSSAFSRECAAVLKASQRPRFRDAVRAARYTVR
jgi:hypothetical protein